MSHSVNNREKAYFWLIGYREGSEPGSNRRRLWSRIALYVSILLVIVMCVNTGRGEVRNPSHLGLLIVCSMILFSFVYFIDVVLRTPFRASDDFVVNPQRLLLDTLISSALMMSVFASAYWQLGFGSGGKYINETRLDSLYFSAVTFSTLGFGDFSPAPCARLLAAVQALIGNIHLGFFVGSAFVAIQNKSSGGHQKEKTEDPEDETSPKQTHPKPAKPPIE